MDTSAQSTILCNIYNISTQEQSHSHNYRRNKMQSQEKIKWNQLKYGNKRLVTNHTFSNETQIYKIIILEEGINWR